MKRKWILAAALVSGIVPVAALAADAPAKAETKAKAPAAPLTSGEVKKVDREAKKVTIQHGPIENLKMPPMTMVFRVKDPAMLDGLEPGAKIRFRAEEAEGGPLGLTNRGYGILLTCLGAGGVLGTMIVGRTNRWLGRRGSMFADIIGSFLLVAVPAVVPAVSASAWAVGAAAFVAGVGGTMWTVNSRVIIQSLVPNEMLGRFSAASRLLGWGTAPVAAALMGLLAQTVGYRYAFGFFAAACILLVVVYLRVVTPAALAEVGDLDFGNWYPGEKNGVNERRGVSSGELALH